MAAAVAVLLLGLVVVAVVAVRGRQPGRASVDQAVDRYRAATTIEPGGQTVEGPRPGVYAFTGSGSEQLSIQASATPLGPALPVTVTREGDACWLVRVDYHASHWQSWHYCFEDGRLLDKGGDTVQSFDFTVFTYDSDVTSVCDPPVEVLSVDAQPGDSWTQGCTSGTGGDASRQEGPATMVGREDITVGDTAVPTYHVREERTISGAQTGTMQVETWIAADTLLPVRNEWSTSLDTPSPGGAGSISFHEQGSWQMAALDPVQ